MGIGLPWLVLIAGAVAGQLALGINLVIWIGAFNLPQRWIHHLVESAVSAGLRHCLDIEPSSTTTTTIRSLWPEVGFDSGFITINWRVDFVLLLSFGTLSLGLILLFCVRGCPRPRFTNSDESPVSPARLEVPLAVVARNQLAELRLRHHGPSRAIRAD